MSSPFPSRSQVHHSQPAPAPTPKPARRGGGRIFLQVLGELLMTIGALLLLYVVWQLWWTTAQVQGGMEQRVSDFQTSAPAPTEYVDTQITEEAPPVEQASMPEGATIGVLHVPKWGMEIPIGEGVGEEVLNNGDAGHYPETQLPGEVGNFAIAGHRRTYGNNFRRIDILQQGDPIVVETKDAWLVYEVAGHEIVLPDAIEVISPVPNEPGVEPTQRIMTMTTCHPEFGNSHRYILWSEMKYWVPKSEGRPDVLQGESN